MDNYFVTGANRGIGYELTKQLLAKGHNVYAACRVPAAAIELQTLKNDYQNLHVLKLDVTDQSQIEVVIHELEHAHIDVLINNAGIYGNREQSYDQVSFGLMQEVFAINAIAPLQLSVALLPNLRQSKQATVINISSKMGSITDNSSGGQYAYRSSKAALNMIMKSLSVDLEQENIQVHVLHPGWVQTDMGGPSAKTSTIDSVNGLIKEIEAIRANPKGEYTLKDFSGKTIPW